LSTAKKLGPATPALTGVNEAGRALLGQDLLPLWSPDLPSGGRSRRRPRPNREPVAVYVPACVNAMFGPEPRDRGRLYVKHDVKATTVSGVQSAFEFLCAWAGVALRVPAAIDSLCCGTPWSSKGMTKGYERMAATVLPILRSASDNGRLPVVCDASSCTEGLQRMVEHGNLGDPGNPDDSLTVVDCIEFVADYILPRLPPLPKVASITLHPTCSSTQIGLAPYLVRIAEAVADTVHVPVDAGCCAFAGDRGLLHPELTHAATRPEAAEVAAANSTVHASCNRTCEIGLTRATGQPYRHLLEVLADQLHGA
jgi:D-lactate dehydrogenase